MLRSYRLSKMLLAQWQDMGWKYGLMPDPMDTSSVLGLQV